MSAALVILGTILASLIIARGRYLNQWTLATHKQMAIEAADKLLTGWWANPDSLPRQGSGMLGEEKLRWRTRLIEQPAATDLEVQVVRLELFDGVQPSVQTSTAQAALTQVDVVVNRIKP